MKKKTLFARTEIEVRYSDADPMGVVWHGNYIKYFEDGREAFGKKYGLSYLNIYRKKFMVPLVDIKCEFKKPLRYGDKAIIETRFIDSPVAKVIFEYSIYRSKDKELAAAGSSTQVFLNDKGELHLTIPEFFSEWKRKYGL